MDSFTEALYGDKSQKEKSNITTNNADSVVVGADAENNAVIIHSLKNLGGNLLRPNDNIVGIVGMGNNPMGVSISTNSFCKEVKQNAPVLENTKNATQKRNLLLSKDRRQEKSRVQTFSSWRRSSSRL